METYLQTCQRLIQCFKYWIGRALIVMIRGYQLLLSPWLGHHCRFHPTCSCYAIDAIEQHGPLRGLYLAVKRLSKCHPWHKGGADPVPLHPKTQHKTVNK